MEISLGILVHLKEFSLALKENKMSRSIYIISITIILLLKNEIYGTDISESKQNFSLQILGGINLASFINQDSDWKSNYKFGLQGKYYINKRLTVNSILSFSRSSTFVKNLKGKLLDYEYIYRLYYDQNFEVSFTDILLYLNYEIYHINDFSTECGLGFGYSFATEDFSKTTNVRYTDEVLEYTPGFFPVLPGETEGFSERNSGIIYNANLSFQYKKVGISFIYTIHKTKIKSIDHLNSVSVLFGYFL
jgi:hypothetical protein